MPIYAYRCATCGHAKDVLQKMSDPLLTVCPACGASTFVKQVTAAGFQLKGSGWYVTDFRGDSSARPAGGEAQNGDAKPDATVAPVAGKSAAAEAGSAPAAAPAAPAPAPSTAAPSSPASGGK
jgi:putative FmdB family regulatory protein